MTDKNEENLPILQEVPKELTEIIFPDNSLTPDSSTNQFMDEDLQHANNAIRAVYSAYSMANSVSKICKLAETTMSVIEKRRKLMLKPASLSDLQGKKRDFGLETLE